MLLKEWLPIVMTASKDPISTGVRGVISTYAGGYVTAFIFIVLVCHWPIVGFLFLFLMWVIYPWMLMRAWDRSVIREREELEANARKSMESQNEYTIDLDSHTRD